MRRRGHGGWMVLATMGLGLATLAAAQAPSEVRLNPKQVKAYTQLTAKAAQQQGHKQAETLAKIAELDFTFANASYRQHNPEAGRQHMQQATAHADRACDLLHGEAQTGKKDGIKNVEKTIQQITFGLRGLEQAVGFRQRDEVHAAVEHFTNLNYELLQWLFAPKS